MTTVARNCPPPSGRTSTRIEFVFKCKTLQTPLIYLDKGYLSETKVATGWKLVGNMNTSEQIFNDLIFANLGGGGGATLMPDKKPILCLLGGFPWKKGVPTERPFPIHIWAHELLQVKVKNVGNYSSVKSVGNSWVCSPLCFTSSGLPGNYMH